MKLKFFNPDTAVKNFKATVHKSGKLGFTVEAAKKLELTTNRSAGIAINEEDETDKNLYVIIYKDKQQGAFNISKAGGYYYINAKDLFDSLKIDYKTDWVTYDISDEVIDNQSFFKFKYRVKKRKSVENE